MFQKHKLKFLSLILVVAFLFSTAPPNAVFAFANSPDSIVVDKEAEPAATNQTETPSPTPQASIITDDSDIVDAEEAANLEPSALPDSSSLADANETTSPKPSESPEADDSSDTNTSDPTASTESLPPPIKTAEPSGDDSNAPDQPDESIINEGETNDSASDNTTDATVSDSLNLDANDNIDEPLNSISPSNSGTTDFAEPNDDVNTPIENIDHADFPSEEADTTAAPIDDANAPIKKIDNADTSGGEANASAAPSGTTDAESNDHVDTTDEDAFDEYVAPGVWSDQDPHFTDDVQPLPDSSAFGNTLYAFIRASCPTYEQALATMLSLQSEYPEGLEWTNFKPYGSQGNLGDAYVFEGGAIKGARSGVGCAAFCFILSDRTFPGLPARVLDSFEYEDLKVGDFLRINNSHFVTILQISPGGIIVAEGNYNKSVHWGRAISRTEVMANTNFVVTRYPVGYSESFDANEELANGVDGTISWSLSKGGTLTLTGSGTIPSNASWNTYNNQINTIAISEGITSIGDSAFGNSKALTVYLPNSLTSIGNYAFSGSNITALSVPSNVRTIGVETFSGCANLTSIDFAEGLSAIGQEAFKGCTSLRAVDLPSSLTKIDAGAFSSCEKLNQVRFMPSKTSIDIASGVFFECWNLQFVSLPDGITALPFGLFQSCQAIYYLYIPASVTSLAEVGEESPFTSSYVGTIYFGGTESEWTTMLNRLKVGALMPTYQILSGAHMEYGQEDPFVPHPDDPGDIQFPCENGHVGEADENGNCTVCGEPIDSPVSPSPSPSISPSPSPSVSPSPEPIPSPTSPAEHTHTWSDKWTTTDTHHWHECISETGDCDLTDDSQKDSYGEHVFSEWIVDREATSTVDGEKYRTCTICEYRETAVIPASPSTTTPPTETDEPSETTPPSGTEKPNETAPPAETENPNETISPSPQPTEQPGSTNTPEPTGEPSETTPPTETEKPSETTSPQPTEQPGNTNTPEPTGKPDQTAPPADTQPPASTHPSTKPTSNPGVPTTAPVPPTAPVLPTATPGVTGTPLPTPPVPPASITTPSPTNPPTNNPSNSQGEDSNGSNTETNGNTSNADSTNSGSTSATPSPTVTATRQPNTNTATQSANRGLQNSENNSEASSKTDADDDTVADETDNNNNIDDSDNQTGSINESSESLAEPNAAKDPDDTIIGSSSDQDDANSPSDSQNESSKKDTFWTVVIIIVLISIAVLGCLVLAQPSIRKLINKRHNDRQE